MQALATAAIGRSVRSVHQGERTSVPLLRRSVAPAKAGRGTRDRPDRIRWMDGGENPAGETDLLLSFRKAGEVGYRAVETLYQYFPGPRDFPTQSSIADNSEPFQLDCVKQISPSCGDQSLSEAANGFLTPRPRRIEPPSSESSDDALRRCRNGTKPRSFPRGLNGTESLHPDRLRRAERHHPGASPLCSGQDSGCGHRASLEPSISRRSRPSREAKGRVTPPQQTQEAEPLGRVDLRVKEKESERSCS